MLIWGIFAIMGDNYISKTVFQFKVINLPTFSGDICSTQVKLAEVVASVECPSHQEPTAHTETKWIYIQYN